MAEFQQDIKEALASTLVYFCKTNVKYSEHMTLHATIGLIVDDNAIIVPVAFSHNASYEKRKQQQEINKQQGFVQSVTSPTTSFIHNNDADNAVGIRWQSQSSDQIQTTPRATYISPQKTIPAARNNTVTVQQRTPQQTYVRNTAAQSTTMPSAPSGLTYIPQNSPGNKRPAIGNLTSPAKTMRIERIQQNQNQPPRFRTNATAAQVALNARRDATRNSRVHWATQNNTTQPAGGRSGFGNQMPSTSRGSTQSPIVVTLDDDPVDAVDSGQGSEVSRTDLDNSADDNDDLQIIEESDLPSFEEKANDKTPTEERVPSPYVEIDRAEPSIKIKTNEDELVAELSIENTFSLNEESQIAMGYTEENSQSSSTDQAPVKSPDTESVQSPGGVEAGKIKRKHSQSSDSNSNASSSPSLGSSGKPGKHYKNADLKEYYVKSGSKFKCVVCQHLLSSATAIMYHIRTSHLNDKQHKCTICAKSFPYESTLKMHMVMHSKKEKTDTETPTAASSPVVDVKIHACIRCDDSFKNRADLMAHIEVEHPELSSTLSTPAKM